MTRLPSSHETEHFLAKRGTLELTSERFRVWDPSLFRRVNWFLTQAVSNRKTSAFSNWSSLEFQPLAPPWFSHQPLSL